MSSPIVASELATTAASIGPLLSTMASARPGFIGLACKSAQRADMSALEGTKSPRRVDRSISKCFVMTPKASVRSSDSAEFMQADMHRVTRRAETSTLPISGASYASIVSNVSQATFTSASTRESSLTSLGLVAPLAAWRISKSAAHCACFEPNKAELIFALEVPSSCLGRMSGRMSSMLSVSPVCTWESKELIIVTISK